MPRPKPIEELTPRSVRLTDKEWDLLTVLGGAAWLREALGNVSAAAKAKAARNHKVRTLAEAEVSDTEIARRVGVDRATVWRIRNAKV